MTVALTAGGLLVLLGDLWLVIACWRRRSVLGAVLGVTGIALVGFAIASGVTAGTGEQALLIAALALVIGSALYGLGQALQRLLDEEPEDAA